MKRKLTEKECIQIAKMAIPGVDWVVIRPKSAWNGYDLIEKGVEPIEARHIFQITYDLNVIYFFDLLEFSIPEENMKNVSNFINKIMSHG